LLEVVAPFSTLLLLLLFNIATLFAWHCNFLLNTGVAPCSTSLLCLAQCYCSLFDIAILPSWHYYCSLFNVFNVPYSTLLLFLFNVTLLAWRYYSSCSSCSLFDVIATLAQCYSPYSTVLLLLLDIVALLLVHLHAACSSTSLLCLWCCCSLLFIRWCCYYSSYFIFVPTPLNFVQVWEELSKFKFFWSNLEGEILLFNFCLLMNFFNCPNCFWEMFVDNVFVYRV
jgi:hypothetical protein